MLSIIPQANSWKTVEKLLMLLNNDNSLTPVDKKYVADYFKFAPRQADYYAHALNFFGFLENINGKIWPLKLNNLGIKAAQGELPGESLHLYVLKYLNNWSVAGLIIENRESEAIKELIDIDCLNEVTAARRVSTIKSWCTELIKCVKTQVDKFGKIPEEAENIIIKNTASLEQKQKQKLEKQNIKLEAELSSIPQKVISGEDDNFNYDKFVTAKARKRYDRFTKGVGLFCNNRCAITGVNHQSLLVNSHIKSWSDSIGFEKIDANNGLLLESRFDKLFDKHLISFDNDGYMIISNILSKEVQEKLNLNLYKKLLIALTEDMKDYMDYHRRKFYEKQKPL